MEKVNTVVQEILEIYKRYGQESYGENITQTEHALQSAVLAHKEGFEDEVIIAALLHDIGHLIVQEPEAKMEENLGAIDHEAVGAKFLRQKGFSEKVCTLVKGHVAGKRYLTFKHPDYYHNLSEASKKTLVHQGGSMTEEEAAAFEQDPFFKLNLKMREWDDKGKIENMELPQMKDFTQIIEAHLKTQL